MSKIKRQVCPKSDNLVISGVQWVESYTLQWQALSAIILNTTSLRREALPETNVGQLNPPIYATSSVVFSRMAKLCLIE